MEKRRLGRTGLEVTKWGLGGISLSTIMGGTTEEAIREVIDAALAYGINFIDTSRVYMDSETNIGEALKGRRDSVVIATKTISRERDSAYDDILTSLEELKTDAIDIYQIHDLRPDEVDGVMGENGAYQAIRRAKEEGKVKHLGLTSHHNQVLVDLIKADAFDVVMIPFNVVEREPEKELLALAKERDIGMLVMKPIAGGAITNIEAAFRFFNSYDVDVILNGVVNLEELHGNLKCAEDSRPLTAQELAAFEEEVKPLGHNFCRRCNYCQPCPSDIIIPPMVHVMYQNTKGKRFEDLPVEKQGTFENLQIWWDVCEECGQCEEACPYGIPTIERKKALAEFAETKGRLPDGI